MDEHVTAAMAPSPHQGREDVRRAADLLAERLPAPLRPLAGVAYNYRWSWAAGGAGVFAAIDEARWEHCGHNPVRLLTETAMPVLERAAARPDVVAAVNDLARLVAADLSRPARAGPVSSQHPVAFLCAEFAVHSSLAIYSGGLGVLAGDILKQASDHGLPMVGVGLLYRTGYFHQRLDLSGYQHEYWIDLDPERLPAVLVTGDDGQPCRVSVRINREDVAVQVWRVDVGRVPLFLLDTDVPGNSTVARWVTSRLYEGNPEVRLAQYAVLGVGGTRMLRALNVDPLVLHLNEGHAALAAVEIAAQAFDTGATPAEAWAAARSRLVFTTHTPVAAGNETYDVGQVAQVLEAVLAEAGDAETVLTLGRGDERPAEVSDCRCSRCVPPDR